MIIKKNLNKKKYLTNLKTKLLTKGKRLEVTVIVKTKLYIQKLKKKKSSHAKLSLCKSVFGQK